MRSNGLPPRVMTAEELEAFWKRYWRLRMLGIESPRPVLPTKNVSPTPPPLSSIKTVKVQPIQKNVQPQTQKGTERILRRSERIKKRNERADLKDASSWHSSTPVTKRKRSTVSTIKVQGSPPPKKKRVTREACAE
ncbi:hypothetical protein BDR04DRAFT_1163880 [Suillus decipiens]|nr:hypothetical protein BDR04DRAFT_1163880 [Suillus decipiens]